MPVAVSSVSLLIGVVILVLPWGAVYAHGLVHDGRVHPAGILSVVVLSAYWALYLWGAMKRPPLRRHSWTFHLATLLCALALFGPLDNWAKVSTAAHMAQHMLLIAVIAPLWVLARPLPQLQAAGGQPMLRVWAPLLRLTRYPVMLAVIHGVVIWFWHTPHFYMLAVDSYFWHVTEHALFLVTAGFFWWAVLRSSVNRAPQALLALLVTLMHTGFLGALLTFSNATLYGEARSLQDQQLAGLIMWVPSAIPYLLASGWVAYHWYRQLRRSY